MAAGPGSGEDYSDQLETFSEDDVLVPVAGILDVLDNYAFVRTSGYLPGPNDVYVPLGLVKKHGLRKGDAVTGAVKALREGEQLPAAAEVQRARAARHRQRRVARGRRGTAWSSAS